MDGNYSIKTKRYDRIRTRSFALVISIRRSGAQRDLTVEHPEGQGEQGDHESGQRTSLRLCQVPTRVGG
jgi:hypothetical protein